MKFHSSALLALSATLLPATTVVSFAPNSPVVRKVTTTTTPFFTNTLVNHNNNDINSSTSLNLFRTVKRKFRKAATVSKTSDITEDEVRALFSLWNSALATGDSRIVASRYTKSPVLLPTVSDKPRTDFDSVKDYFDAFLLKEPQGEIVEGYINIGDGWASDTGIYEFTMGTTGDVVKARYSYVYVQEDGIWKIQHHHSSVMPEENIIGVSITDDEVKGLFNLWNDALATLDPKKVANRYAKQSVLLPTVSDTPRTDYALIEDYFTNFLKLKPQGEILESNVVRGINWAQDCGIYEFTMGTTGKKVKGRYSFVYVYEDGEWKISHHHSSIMPEGIVTAEPISETEVRDLFQLWNGALATKDPEKVADRYSKSGVLLPTVSDVPRTDYPGIVDYFTNFLKLEPQGEILDGNIIVGTNWAQDAGIYEFTMGATGAKVKGRYTYVYVFEDGEWKISQHHSSVMPEAGKPQAITDDEVKGLFQLWNSALATEDPDAVASRYSKNAVLLPTVSDIPRTDYDLIKDYFVGFLQKKPQGEILESNVIVGHNWCQDAGIYEFTMGATGDKVKGRYSFVYVWEDGQWKIAHHHSSVMPEAFLGSPAPAADDSIDAPQPITESEVKDLFQLWNGALATLDSDKVAKRYAKNSVLLPTVSDVPRTDYDLIKDYFDGFLKKEPQGEILESNVTIGHNWCQDVGIYEFTMGDTGDKVKGRYSFVYVYEDGEWKISHHHSSVMPEAFLGPAPKPNVNGVKEFA